MATVIPMGVLLPDSLLQNELVAVLAAFVAINTIFYVTLAVARSCPRSTSATGSTAATGGRRPAASTLTHRSDIYTSR